MWKINFLNQSDIIGDAPGGGFVGSLSEDGNSGNLFSLFGDIINISFIIAGVVFVLMIIYYGFIYLTQGGDENAVKKGRAGLGKAILGFIIVAFAFAIASTIRFVIANIGNVDNSS
jgi:hypothetical protein